MRRSVPLGLALSLLAVACAGARPSPVTRVASDDVAHATLRDAEGRDHGSAVIRQRGRDLVLLVRASGFAPGPKGIHIHTVGECAGPDFKSAGGHWNPLGREHGMDNPSGPHMGDLVNIVIGRNGSGTLNANIPNARLRSGPSPLLDADGAAIVVHAAVDDLKTDPSGNSGARVACGVFVDG